MSSSDPLEEIIKKVQNQNFELMTQNDSLRKEIKQLKQEALSGLELMKLAITLEQNKLEIARLKQIIQDTYLVFEELSPWDSNPSRRDPCLLCGETGHDDNCDYMRVKRLLQKECEE